MFVPRLKKWFRWLLAFERVQQRSGCNFHHQDWPSLRDNDRHHVGICWFQAAAAGATRISHGSTEATAQRLQRPILTYVEPED